MGDPLSKITLELPQILNSKLYTPRDYNRTVFWEFEDIQMLLGNVQLLDLFDFLGNVEVSLIELLNLQF